VGVGGRVSYLVLWKVLKGPSNAHLLRDNKTIARCPVNVTFTSAAMSMLSKAQTATSVPSSNVINSPISLMAPDNDKLLVLNKSSHGTFAHCEFTSVLSLSTSNASIFVYSSLVLVIILRTSTEALFLASMIAMPRLSSQNSM